MDGQFGQPENSLIFRTQRSLERRLEFFRTRVYFKSIDAAMMAVLGSGRSLPIYLYSIVHPKSSNYERITSLVNLINLILPGTSHHIAKRLCKTHRIPFYFQDLRLLSYGSGSSVFLIRLNEKYSVLKFYRRSLGRSLDGLLEIAREYRGKHATISLWYNGEFQLVPHSSFLILQSPVIGCPAAALLQPYIRGEKKDLFLDFTDEQILHLMQQDSFLAGQFRFFARKTLQIYENEGRCFDFVGRNNLLLTKDEGGRRFVIIDNGIFELNTIQSKRPDIYSKLQVSILRLRKLLSELDHPKK